MKTKSLLTILSIAFLVASVGLFVGCDDEPEAADDEEATEEETEETEDEEAAEEEEADDSEVAEDADSPCIAMCQLMADCDLGDEKDECIENCESLYAEIEETGDEDCIAAHDALIVCQTEPMDCDDLEAAYMGEDDPCTDESSAFQEACF